MIHSLQYSKKGDFVMIQTLQEFIEEFKRIKHKGWIKTHRKGNTGIGKTLEDELGIAENNEHAPDFGEYELKSKRQSDTSMLTLFTKSPCPPKANAYILNKYGYLNEDNNDLELHTTLWASRFTSLQRNNKKLKIKYDKERIWIASDTDDERNNVYWNIDDLIRSFEQKYKGKFVYAYAQSKGHGAEEEFLYDEAFEVSGFDANDFLNLLKSGDICIDFRLGHYHSGPNIGKVHDHGTAFRIKGNSEHKLFKLKRKIV